MTSRIALGAAETGSDDIPSSALYAKSELKPKQTRFLTISPAPSLSAPVVCKLQVVDLYGLEIEQFEALSYTWGDDDASNEITVDEHRLLVRDNLFDALRYLRGEESSRTIWIDAICIDQGRPLERNSQVLHMGRIFSATRQVVVWLGVEDKVQDGGLLALSHESGDEFPSTRKAIRLKVGTLFQRPWWYRTWTVQEYMNARSRIFVCGSIVFAGDTVLRICEAFSRAMECSTDNNRHIYGMVTTHNARGKVDLRNVMLNFGYRDAKDPRDKIYAFLGLARDSAALGIVPDYDNTREPSTRARPVYTSLVQRYCAKEGHMEIICTHHRGERKLDLPSWVPDWSIPYATWKNWTVDKEGFSFFSAGFPPNSTRCGSGRSHGQLPSARTRISFTDDKTLVVGATDVGCVEKVSPGIGHRQFECDDWIDCIRAWKPEDVDAREDSEDQTRFKAFCRTITADSNGMVRGCFNSGSIARSQDKALRRMLSTGEVAEIIHDALRQAAYHSCFATLSQDRYAMVPTTAEMGDLVVVLRGCSTPMALRRTTSQDPAASATYQMIGPCFVHGVMDGEMADEPFVKTGIV